MVEVGVVDVKEVAVVVVVALVVVAVGLPLVPDTFVYD